MTIHIKDQYQPDRELTVAQVNLELQQGTISAQAMAWQPGFEKWVPVLSHPDIQAPVPPPISDHDPNPKLPLMSETSSLIPKKQHAIWRILAAIGIVLAYVILTSTVFSAGEHPGRNKFGPLWAGICSILLFRRMLRLRGEAVVLQNPQSKLLSHYYRSYASATWRWLLIFIGISILCFVAVETPEEAGTVIGTSIAIMIFGMLFALDIPYRVFRAYSKHQEKPFRQRNVGWILFLVAVIALLIFRFASSPTIRSDHAGAQPVTDEQYYTSSNQVWEVTDTWVGVTGIETSNLDSTLSAKSLYKEFSPAVVTIITKSAKPGLIIESNSLQGTGLILRSPNRSEKAEYMLLTCHHVIEGMNGKFILQNSRGRTINASAVVALVDVENDWCLIPIRLADEHNFDELAQMHMSDKIAEVGEDVFAIGSPEGMGSTLSKGIISSIRTAKHGKWIQTTCPISPGSSGSPSFDSTGAFLGIAVESFIDGQNINFFVSAQTMKERFNSDELSVVHFTPQEDLKTPYRISPKIWDFVEHDTFLKKKRFQRKELDGRVFPQQLHLYEEPMNLSNEYYKNYREIYPGVMLKSQQLTNGNITITVDMSAGNEFLVSIETWPLPRDRDMWADWISAKVKATLADLEYTGEPGK